MNYICPQPKKWHEIYTVINARLQQLNDPDIPLPPKPLILNGWVLSNDDEKRIRWAETLQWINKYFDAEIVENLKDEDKYFG